jgi:RNA polymerase sigma-70 factor, ECF subfamily
MIVHLLDSVRRKKKKAQQEFYYKYSVQMFRLSYRYVNNEDDAGSIVNSSFFKIFNHIDKFVYINEKCLIAWMKKIVINEALIFLRGRFYFEELQNAGNKLVFKDDITDNQLILEDYYRMIKELPDDLRTVFNMYAIDGFSHKEIAEQLDIKESSSRVYLSRARKVLQDKLISEIK